MLSSSSSLKKSTNKWIELGDIIEITSPERTEWHEQIFFVSYIDTTILELIDIKSVLPFLFHLSPTTGNFKDTSIKKVKILSRSSLKGYARQNGLFKNIWIDLFFGGDVPKSITGEITNLEEDMIELTTYPENKLLYIDFAYQGVPRNIPLKKICIREKPASFHRGLISNKWQGEEGKAEGKAEESERYRGIEGQELEEGEIPDENYHERLQKLYKLQELEEEEELQEVVQQIEIPPEFQQYGINAQVNDLLDAFLSTIPDYKRTPFIMNQIYTHIQRFKELREQFSIFDDKYHQIIGPKRADTQPFVKSLFNMSTSIPWCIPVVSQTKNVYGEFEEEYFDINIKDIETDANNEIENENRIFYKNNIPDENMVKYANMYIQNAPYMSPFIITDLNKQLALHTLPKINTDIDVIVSSDAENTLHSYVADGEDNLMKTKFLMERYNSEILYPYKKNPKSKETSLFATLIPSDALSFRSLFILPEPFIAFSKIKLPNSSILQKTLLHRKYPYYFQYLNKKTAIKEKTISLENTGNISEAEEESSILSFSQFQHFVLSNIDDTAQSLDSSDKLLAFLKKSVPTLNELVNNYLQKQTRKPIYTFLDAVDILEPFSIYLENLNWKIANSIKQLLYKNIDKYKSNIAFHSSIYQSLLLEKYKYELYELQNAVLFLLEENKEQQQKCIENYSLTTSDIFKNTSTSEWLKDSQVKDQSRLLVLYLRILNSILYTPEDLLGVMEDSETEKDKPSKKQCWKRTITKKYYSVSDLRGDNNKPIIVDKELDSTDYSVVDKYKKEQPELDDTEFLEFVAENLITKNHYERENAFHTAKNMIAGERFVEEDEYAILENIPKLSPDISKELLTEKEKNEIELETETKKRIMYFIRKKNVWIHVPELDELSFVDNNTLICNIDKNCYSNTKKKSCDNANTTLNQFREYDLERMRTEFKNRYNISMEDKKQEIETEMNDYESWMANDKKLQYNNLTYIDIQSYKRGTNAVLQEIIISPYIELRDSILAKNIDFVTRQQYIILFVNKYCREPMLDEPMSENVHWLYCKETNTKLMPRSLFLLAKGYKDDNYALILDQLCNTIGKLSDDGDAYIDKYSGYILKKIEFREEGIEIIEEQEGIWEKGSETEDISKSFENIVIQKKQKKTERIFLNETDQKIYNIISTICSNIHLENDNLIDSMMQFSQEWLQINAIFPSEKTYMKMYDKMMEKRKQNPKLLIPDDFNTYNQKNYIIISAISVLIVIQTTIPDIQIKKTFSRCIKSFYGFPLKEGQDDLSSIKYIACVLREMYLHNKDDKKLVPKKESELENNILDILKNHILKLPQILQLYDNKRKDILINSIVNRNEELEEKENVENKWQHFLPPITPFFISAKELQSICPASSKKQEILNICIIKTRLLSLTLIENLRDIIAKKNILFQTKSGLPYLQNACCDEVLQYPPISVLEYFKEQDNKGVIKKTLEIIWKNANRIELIKENRKAFLLLKPKEKIEEEILDKYKEKDKKRKQNIFMSYEPSIYYGIAIHYCHLESEIYPIPEELHTICSKKPMNSNDDYYDKNMSMIEKMDYLSKHQVKMDAIKAIELMNIINKRNFVVTNNYIDISVSSKIQIALEQFQEINHDLKIVFKSIGKWISSEYTEFPSNKITILKFIQRKGSIKLNENAMNQKMSILYNWENYKNISISSLSQKMKSILSLFGIIYPSYLGSSNNSIKIPKHWELTEIDEKYLEKELHNYKNILEKYHQNPILLPIFNNIIHRVQPLITIMNFSFSILSDNANTNKNEVTIKKMYDLSIFCLELLIMTYIELISQPEIYKEISNAIREKKQNNRIETENNANSTLILDIEDEDIVEEEMDFSVDTLNNIEKEMADYLLAVISTIRTKQQVNVKEPFMMTYADIIAKMDYYRDKEKQKIKDYLKNMSSEERKAEIILKKLHLGVFEIDNKKLTTYGKETGFYEDVFQSEKEKRNEVEILEDLGEIEKDDMVYANGEDEDDNLDIQQNEDDYEDMNDNAYEDYYESEYN